MLPLCYLAFSYFVTESVRKHVLCRLSVDNNRNVFLDGLGGPLLDELDAPRLAGEELCRKPPPNRLLV